MKVQNPHDKFFKETFSNVEIARDFMQNYLPEPILKIVDLQTLDIQKDSFIDENLKEVFSDMLFHAKINQRDGYLYFLFEHKSYTSRNVVLQLLNYMVRIWEQKAVKENARQIPVIIPLLIYHGKEKWEIGNTLADLITDYDALPDAVKEMTPNFRYQIYDLSQFSDADIKGNAQLAITLSIFRDIFQKSGEAFLDTIIQAAKAMNELEEKQTGIQYFETCMRYILNAGPQLTNNQLNKVLKQIELTYPEGSEVTMTLAEVLRKEGLEEGLAEGRKEGETKALSKMAIKVLTKKFGTISKEDIVTLENLNSASLELIIEEFWQSETLDELKQKYF